MLTLPTSVPIFVAATPVDLRRSFDGLAQAARDALGQDPQRGGLFLFFNRNADRVKLIFWDRTGYVILYKRLERGTFAVPRAAEGQRSVQLDVRDLATLLEGTATTAPQSTRGKSP